MTMDSQHYLHEYKASHNGAQERTLEDISEGSMGGFLV